MSQTLMKTERDIGVMLTMEPRRKNDKLKYIKIDIGIFNGQGLNGPGEFDGFKDIIGRIGLKPFPISKKITFSAGASYLHGGIIQNTKYQYQMGFAGGNKTFLVDSSTSNIGKKNPRVYQGFDAQLKWKNKWGAAELRGEYWWGTQTAGASTNETPGILLAAGEGYYIRRFNGAFFYLLQNIINTHHQVGIKIDWFDPNTKVTAGEIGKSSINATNIKYTTYGMGYNYYINENLKVMLWYHVVNNEKTQLVGYTSDLHDNILTCRLQYRF